MPAVDLLEVVRESLYGILASVIVYTPRILGALLILIVGVIVARSLEFAISKIIEALRIDVALRKVGMDRYIERAGFALNSGDFFGKIFYWLVMLVVVLGISKTLGLNDIANFIEGALGWIFSDLLVAVVILVVSAFFGQFLRKLVSASVMGAKLHSANFLGTLTFWIVMTFGFITAVKHLGIDTSLVDETLKSLLLAIPISVGLAFGLAFGLGGKNQAEKLLEKMEEKAESNR